MRHKDLYAELMGAYRRDNPDIVFTTGNGLKVKLVWTKNEYRAWKASHGGWMDMKLGSSIPEPLQKYIEEHF